MKKKTIIYDEIKWHLYPNEKYYKSHASRKGIYLERYLHRYKWEKEVGKIPKNYEVHHIDKIRTNNDISNLQCLSSKEHSKIHWEESSEEYKQKVIKSLNEKARPKASEWHGSKEGIEWHRQHALNCNFGNLTYGEYECEICGKKFIKQRNHQRFCSNNCKSAYRRKTGVDNEQRVCVICGTEFTTNKYSKTQTCNKKCGRQLTKKKYKPEEKKCECCGIKFKTKRANQKFCSIKCIRTTYSQNKQKIQQKQIN